MSTRDIPVDFGTVLSPGRKAGPRGATHRPRPSAAASGRSSSSTLLDDLSNGLDGLRHDLASLAGDVRDQTTQLAGSAGRAIGLPARDVLVLAVAIVTALLAFVVAAALASAHAPDDYTTQLRAQHQQWLHEQATTDGGTGA